MDDRTVQLLEFKFQLDAYGKPWLKTIKGDFSFKIKDNMFDDMKAHLLNSCMQVVEDKLQTYRQLFSKKDIYTAKIKPTRQPIFQKKHVTMADAIKHLDNVPQAFYLYKH